MLRLSDLAVDLTRHLEALFAPGVVCAQALLRRRELPGEQRCEEFATGRALAKRLLGDLGGPDWPLTISDHGAPLWPCGFTGSIAHSDTWCVVAVARGTAFAALGVDVEPIAPLAVEVLDLIAVPSERAWVLAVTGAERELRGKQLFCAKESFFKCLGPSAQDDCEHRDLEIAFGPSRSGFIANLTARGAQLAALGRVGAMHGHAVAAAWIGPGSA